jgi:hypothetical protein
MIKKNGQKLVGDKVSDAYGDMEHNPGPNTHVFPGEEKESSHSNVPEIISAIPSVFRLDR